MYIKLKTRIPHPQDIKEYELYKKYEPLSLQQPLPIIWNKAEDFLVYDRHDNRFLDFTSGICVTNVGHGNKQIIRGLKHQLERPLLYSYTFPTDVRYWFTRELVDTCYPNGKAFLLSSGTEAVECAIKTMRLYGLEIFPEKRIIISFRGAMHGKTMLSEQLNENSCYWATYNDFLYNLDFPAKNSIFNGKDLFYSPTEIIGFIIESYQGWSAKFYSKRYIQNLVKWDKENDILICFDEIQGGFGRTGKMFAFEHYGLTYKDVDLICLGKGISSSLPLSAVLGRADLLDIPDDLSSTHSANPLSCIAGLKSLLELKRLNLIEESKRKGLILWDVLANIHIKHPKKYQINSKGLLAAIITNTVEEADKIVWKCFKKGLLLIWTHRNSVKIAPPLTIKDNALEEGLEILKEIINEN